MKFIKNPSFAGKVRTLEDYNNLFKIGSDPVKKPCEKPCKNPVKITFLR